MDSSPVWEFMSEFWPEVMESGGFAGVLPVVPPLLTLTGAHGIQFKLADCLLSGLLAFGPQLPN